MGALPSMGNIARGSNGSSGWAGVVGQRGRKGRPHMKELLTALRNQIAEVDADGRTIEARLIEGSYGSRVRL